MNFRYYTIQAAIWIAIVATLILSSCSQESDYNFSAEGSPGIAFSLRVEQDEVTAEQMTRAVGAAEMPIRQMKYTIKKKTGESRYETVSTSQGFLSPDFSKLTVEGLEEGEYAIIFYATTQSGGNIPQPADDGTLTNPDNDKPLNVDYLFARVEFAVDGIKGETPQTIPVSLKHCVGQVKVDLKGSYYERRLITSVEVSVINTNDIAAKHTDNENGYADDAYSTITDLSLAPEEMEFYSFPSKPGTTLTGTIKVNFNSPNGTPSTNTKEYMFHNLKIEEGKISSIQLDWDVPGKNGVLYLAREDLDETNSYEMFNRNEPEEIRVKRSFYADKPFQVSLDKEQRLHTALYGPVKLQNVKIMCRMKAYSNEFFQIAYYENYPAFYETWLELPVVKKETTFLTESGKTLVIPAQPELSVADCEFKIVNNSEYMKNVNRIKYSFKVLFNHVREPNVPILAKFCQPVSPRYGRMACIMVVNFAALFGSEEFEKGVKAYKAIPFVYDTKKPAEGDNLIPIEEIIKNARKTKNMKVAELHWVDDPVLGAVTGMAAPEISTTPAPISLKAHALEFQLLDMGQNIDALMPIYHEYGHIMGYDHSSSMCSYNSAFYAWPNCCAEIIRDKMINGRKLPVNSISEVRDVIWNWPIL